MAKKVRRVRRSRRPRAEVSEAKTPVESKSVTRKELAEEDLREEYAYVAKDLRRMAILAVAMFALLILLNLLIQ